MSRLLKVVLTIEVIICFAPVVALLLMGLVILPVGFVMEPRLDNLDGLAMLIGGLCGTVAMVAVVGALISGERSQLSTRTILVLAALGIASLLPLVVGSVDSFRWRVIGLLPILASLHVIYLARSLLFKHQSDTQSGLDDV